MVSSAWDLSFLTSINLKHWLIKQNLGLRGPVTVCNHGWISTCIWSHHRDLPTLSLLCQTNLFLRDSLAPTIVSSSPLHLGLFEQRIPSLWRSYKSPLVPRSSAFNCLPCRHTVLILDWALVLIAEPPAPASGKVYTTRQELPYKKSRNEFKTLVSQTGSRRTFWRRNV